MILAHRIRLDPNNVQRSWLDRCAGASRFAYNWSLARWKELYAAKKKVNWCRLNSELNACKGQEFPWLLELPWLVPAQSIRDLGTAFSNFFRRRKLRAKNNGYPRFKKKGRCREGFSVEARRVVFDGRRIKFPGIGWLRMCEPLRFPGKLIAVRCVKQAAHWYVSISVEVDEARWSYPHRCETQAAVGVDLGLVDLAVLSTGERISAPRALRRFESKLRTLNKELHRRKEGGRNREKTRVRLARLHERIANIRQATTHKLTASLVRRFRWIGVETLSVSGMRHGTLAKSVNDAAIAEVLRQLSYKAPPAGSTIVRADRFYPSSKTCSACGLVREDLPLGCRRWKCECGAEHDRDENAAKNLEALAAVHAVTACRHGSTGDDLTTVAKLLPGQEVGSLVVS